MKLLVFLLLPYLSLSEVFQDFNQCSQFFLKNVPPRFIPPLSSTAHICQCVWNESDVKTYVYATLYNTAWRIPIYSAYVFEKPRSIGRCDLWYIEPQLDRDADPCNGNNADPCMSPKGRKIINNQAVNSDYDGSGYDKGHLYPVQHTNNHLSMLATSTLTNAAPQNSTFNRGAWKTHEKAVKVDLQGCDYALAYVVTGVVPDINIKIPTNNRRVTVSKYYWRATCCVKNGVVMVQGYYGPDNNDKLQKLSITDLQKQLAKDYKVRNIIIFPNLLKRDRED
ncbi:endonuclease domain-containing 1 protein-like [Chanodichthys erythropterus]|uniref:endonuclease domain-containing 1 protein-like n=1 Tax=Chanodichthys erythropterus TaxID=933992 RepID=UPI00351E121A